LCTNVIRVAATNNGRPQYGNQAFLVCKTEESKLQALENTLSENPNVSNAAMSSHRNALKEELLRR
jgi:hypothetical protein